MNVTTQLLTDAEITILAQERRALDQWSAGNALGYIQIDADDVTYFDDIGAHTRVDGIEAMRTYFASLEGKIPPHNYEIEDHRVQIYDNVAILTFHYQPYTEDGTRITRWKASSIYRWMGQECRIVHAHWSLVK
jgi:hypothetical protein